MEDIDLYFSSCLVLLQSEGVLDLVQSRFDNLDCDPLERTAKYTNKKISWNKGGLVRRRSAEQRCGAMFRDGDADGNGNGDGDTGGDGAMVI